MICSEGIGDVLTDKLLHVFGVLLRDTFEKYVHQLEPTLRPGFQDYIIVFWPGFQD